VGGVSITSVQCCGVQAYVGLREYEEAIVYFSKVKELEPENKAAQRELLQARNKIKAFKEKEKRMYASMFTPDSKENQ